MDQQALVGDADLTGVEHAAVHDHLHGLVDVGVVQYDQGIVSAKLKHHAGQVLRSVLVDVDTGGGAARQGDAVDQRRLSQQAANDGALAGNDLNRFLGNTGADEHIDHVNVGSRRIGGRLDNDGVACGQRGRYLVREQIDGEVERDHADHDAEWLLRDIDEIGLAGQDGLITVTDQLCIAGEQRADIVDLRQSLRIGLSGLLGLQRCNGLLLLAVHFRGAQQDLRTLNRLVGAPDLFAALRGLQRSLYILRSRLRYRFGDFAGSGVYDVDDLLVAVINPFAIDDHFHAFILLSMEIVSLLKTADSSFYFRYMPSVQPSSHVCSLSSIRVLSHGSPGRWRIPHA